MMCQVMAESVNIVVLLAEISGFQKK